FSGDVDRSLYPPAYRHQVANVQGAMGKPGCQTRLPGVAMWWRAGVARWSCGQVPVPGRRFALDRACPLCADAEVELGTLEGADRVSVGLAVGVHLAAFDLAVGEELAEEGGGGHTEAAIAGRLALVAALEQLVDVVGDDARLPREPVL